MQRIKCIISYDGSLFSGYQVQVDKRTVQGEIEAVVIATGVHTFFGKAAHLVENTKHIGHFQKVHIQKKKN